MREYLSEDRKSSNVLTKRNKEGNLETIITINPNSSPFINAYEKDGILEQTNSDNNDINSPESINKMESLILRSAKDTLGVSYNMIL
jgi:hypothetical protein